MTDFWDFLKTLLDPQSIIHYGGLALLCAVVFMENGVFFGFFLPGDNLILFSGILTATGVIDSPIWFVESCLIFSAIGGYCFGYWFGWSTGKGLYKRKDTLFFRRSYVTTADEYFVKYGGRTLIIGRFLPIVRTFAPIVAGIIKMNIRTFMVYNIAGSVLWIGLISTIGYALGIEFKDEILKYSGYIIIGLIAITTLPIALNLYKRNRKKGV